MALPLRVCQVVALVAVDRQAQLALVAVRVVARGKGGRGHGGGQRGSRRARARRDAFRSGRTRGRAGEDDDERDGGVSSPSEVVAHEIRVLGEVDGLERESAEALAAIDRLMLRSGGTTKGRGERA